MIDYPLVCKESNLCSVGQSSPLVSIVIPVFNRCAYIIEALDSALSQEYNNIEIVICDNASTDGTFEICVAYASALRQVTIARHASNIGPVPNWLSCVRLAKGDLIKFLFSDDILLPNCLSAMVDQLTEACGLVYSACFMGPSLTTAQTLYASRWHKDILSRRLALLDYALLRTLPVSPCAALLRKEDVITSLENSLAEPPCLESIQTGAGPDVYLFLDVLLCYTHITRINRPLVFFRSHDDSFTTGKARLSVLRGYKLAFRRFYRRQSLPLYFATFLAPLVQVTQDFLSSFLRLGRSFFGWLGLLASG